MPPFARLLACASILAAACDGIATSPADGGGYKCGTCPVWTVACGDACVDPSSDPRHCGACFNRCDDTKQVCHGGVCMPSARCSELPSPAADAGAPPPSTMGLRGEYFASEQLVSLALARVDGPIDFVWTMSGPDPSLPKEHYSVRWSGTVTPKYSETYDFAVTSDDGARLWVNGQLLIDDFAPHGLLTDHGKIALKANTPVAIRLEYLQVTGAAEVHLAWASTSQPSEVVPAAALAPATGALYTCAGGDCCATGGGLPICCLPGTRCVSASTFSGCCPDGTDCTVVATCSK